MFQCLESWQGMDKVHGRSTANTIVRHLLGQDQSKLILATSLSSELSVMSKFSYIFITFIEVVITITISELLWP